MQRTAGNPRDRALLDTEHPVDRGVRRADKQGVPGGPGMRAKGSSQDAATQGMDELCGQAQAGTASQGDFLFPLSTQSQDPKEGWGPPDTGGGTPPPPSMAFRSCFQGAGAVPQAPSCS